MVTKAQATFHRILGEDTVEADLAGTMSRYYFPFPAPDAYGRLDQVKCANIFDKDRNDIASSFRTQIEFLEEQLALEPAISITTVRMSKPVEPVGSDIFVVHGQDVQVKVEVTLFLTRAGLNPVVLHEQPNGGQTIIEKFENHANVAGFAVVLLTPDDVGGPKGGTTRPRARQNVIGEMFWFAGKLGRKRVCALKKGEIEIPSDFAGLAYTDMDAWGAWKSELLRELAQAGFTVDWQKALS